MTNTPPKENGRRINSHRAMQIVRDVVKYFKQLRLKKGLSHEALACKIGVSRPAISHIESGKRRPSLLLAIKIAQGLDVKLSALLRVFEKNK